MLAPQKHLHILLTIGKEDWRKYGDAIFSRINKFRLEFRQGPPVESPSIVLRHDRRSCQQFGSVVGRSKHDRTCSVCQDTAYEDHQHFKNKYIVEHLPFSERNYEMPAYCVDLWVTLHTAQQ
jgi:hypothetical protein